MRVRLERILTQKELQAEVRALRLGHVALDHVDLAEADLRGSRFEHVSFCGSDFSGANLEGVSFVACDLRGADFSGARLAGACFEGSWVTGLRGLGPEQWEQLRTSGAWFL